MDSKLVTIDAGAIRKAEWIERRDELIEMIADVDVVDSEAILKETGALQTEASKHLKELEKIRKAVKAPITKLGKQIDAEAKVLAAELSANINKIKKLNGDFATKLAAEAEAERQRIAEEEARRVQEMQTPQAINFGGLEIPQNIDAAPIADSAPLPTGKVRTGSNAMVTVWEFEVVNQSLIPREFLSVDERKIREFMNFRAKIGDTPELPGCRFSKRVDVRSR